MLDRPFEQMWLAFTHEEAGLHVVIEVRIKRRVLLGQEEMDVRLAGRFEECDPRPGEDVVTYVRRVRALACDFELETKAHEALGGLKRRLTNALSSSLYGATVTPHSTQLVLQRPTLIASTWRSLTLPERRGEPRLQAAPLLGPWRSPEQGMGVHFGLTPASAPATVDSSSYSVRHDPL